MNTEQSQYLPAIELPLCSGHPGEISSPECPRHRDLGCVVTAPGGTPGRMLFDTAYEVGMKAGQTEAERVTWSAVPVRQRGIFDRAVAAIIAAVVFNQEKILKAPVITPTQPDIVVDPRFVEAMNHELAANQHKGDWSKWVPDVAQIQGELYHHLDKLNSAVMLGNPAAVREHAADLALIAMKAFQTFGEMRWMRSWAAARRRNNDAADVSV
jgi:hypothetical protein